MIPLYARAREREALENHPFTFDGTAVERLESAVCAYHSCRHAVAFNHPESAMTAALLITGGIGGKRVVTGAMAPQYHYNALTRTHADLRCCDIGLDGNLYARALEPIAEAEDAACVVFAHFAGIRTLPPHPAGSVVIEDLSASIAPAEVKDVTVWSLETAMPEGVEKTGFILTDDDTVAETARLFSVSGRRDGALWNYDLLLKGADAALGALGAAVALKQMQRLGEICERLRANASALDEALGGNTLFDRFKRTEDDVPSVYPILLTPQLYCPKEDIFSAIRQQNVEAGVCCKPVYKTKAFRDDALRLPVTEDFYKALLQLPCHHRLLPGEIDTIAAALREATDTYAYRGCRF